MGYLKYARPAIIISLILLSIILIHPFTREGVVIASAEYPASLGLKRGDILTSVNGFTISSVEDFNEIISEINPDDMVEVHVLRETFPYRYTRANYVFIAGERNEEAHTGLIAKPSTSSRFNFGFVVGGGSELIAESTQQDAVEIIESRLKINRIQDFSVERLNGQIRIVTLDVPERITSILERRGDFVAKIGDEVFFTTEDVEDYCTTGADCVVSLHQFQDSTPEGMQILWRYGFQVFITKDTSERFMTLVENLSIGYCEFERCWLEEPISYYLDGELIGEEEILAESKDYPYSNPIIVGKAPTMQDAEKRLRFAQSSMEGTLELEVKDYSQIHPTNPGLFNSSIIVWIMVVLFSGIVVFFVTKNLWCGSAGLVAGFSEMIIVLGIVTGLNIVISYQTIAAFITAGAITFAYQFYIVSKVKKEGSMKGKLLEISRGMNKYFFIAMGVLFVLIFFASRFAAPLLIHVSVVFLLTRQLIFSAFKK